MKWIKSRVTLPYYIKLNFTERIIPWIIVLLFTPVTNAFGLSDLKLDKVYNPVPSVTNVFWFCEVVLFKIEKLVLNEFNVPNTFKPDIYNEPFKIVVLSKLVNPLTFNEDNNVVLLFNVVNPLTFNDETNQYNITIQILCIQSI